MKTEFLLDGDGEGAKLMAVLEGDTITLQTTIISQRRVTTKWHFSIPVGRVLALAEAIKTTRQKSPIDKGGKV